MPRRLFVKKSQHQETLADFAKRLAVISQSSPWEERESVNYPEGYYFRQYVGRLEIVAQIADDAGHPAADFLIWIRKGEDSGARMNGMKERLIRHGYAVTTNE